LRCAKKELGIAADRQFKVRRNLSLAIKFGWSFTYRNIRIRPHEKRGTIAYPPQCRVFFGNIASKLAHVYAAISVRYQYFFPRRVCDGCTAYVVWAKKRALTAKPISFVSHVITSVFPAYSWILQAADGESFVMISSKQPEGVSTEVQELRTLSPQSD